MNKLLMKSFNNLEDGIYDLLIKEDTIININGKVDIIINNQIFNNIEFNVFDNSILNIYIYDNLINNNSYIKINEKNNSNVFVNYALITNKDSSLIIDNYLLGNNSTSNINIRNISNKEYSKIIINEFIEENTINNEALEDLKGINNGGCVYIEPNIVCKSNEVIANHETTIGGIDKRIVNYLMSKGICESDAKKLLLDGFIKSIIKEYMEVKYE